MLQRAAPAVPSCIWEYRCLRSDCWVVDRFLLHVASSQATAVMAFRAFFPARVRLTMESVLERLIDIFNYAGVADRCRAFWCAAALCLKAFGRQWLGFCEHRWFHVCCRRLVLGMVRSVRLSSVLSNTSSCLATPHPHAQVVFRTCHDSHHERPALPENPSIVWYGHWCSRVNRSCKGSYCSCALVTLSHASHPNPKQGEGSTVAKTAPPMRRKKAAPDTNRLLLLFSFSLLTKLPIPHSWEYVWKDICGT